MDTVGVMDAVYSGWNRKAKTEECFKEILDSSSLGQRRSDLTDSKSMKLYCSFFDDSLVVSNLEMNSMSGGKEQLYKTLPKNISDCQPYDPFLLTKFQSKNTNVAESNRPEVLHNARSKMLGLIPFNKNSASSAALFPNEALMKIPRGYEQINDDLYARKDNRFMVFNGVGLENDWPPKPISKINSLSSDITVIAQSKIY